MFYVIIPEGWSYNAETKSLEKGDLPDESIKVKAIVNGYIYRMPIHDFEVSRFTPRRGMPFVACAQIHKVDKETEEIITEDVLNYYDGSEVGYPSIIRSKGFGR